MSQQESSDVAGQDRDEITHQSISDRAYEISQADQAGTADENWARAEAELRGQAPDSGLETSSPSKDDDAPAAKPDRVRVRHGADVDRDERAVVL